MSSVIDQIADIERELLALTANQPPNPAQIATFRVDYTSVGADEIKTIVFDDVPRFIQIYGLSNQAAYIYYSGGQLKAKIIIPSTNTLISLGAFSLA
jgi:methionine synthase I (cobalamin-dependent)